MTRLYLLRHGIAVPHGTPDIPDDERPLTSEGEKGVRKVARGLRRLGFKLDRIVTSPLPGVQDGGDRGGRPGDDGRAGDGRRALRRTRCNLHTRLGHRPHRVSTDAGGAQPEPDRPRRPPDHGQPGPGALRVAQGGRGRPARMPTAACSSTGWLGPGFSDVSRIRPPESGRSRSSREASAFPIRPTPSRISVQAGRGGNPPRQGSRPILRRAASPARGRYPRRETADVTHTDPTRR